MHAPDKMSLQGTLFVVGLVVILLMPVALSLTIIFCRTRKNKSKFKTTCTSQLTFDHTPSNADRVSFVPRISVMLTKMRPIKKSTKIGYLESSSPLHQHQSKTYFNELPTSPICQPTQDLGLDYLTSALDPRTHWRTSHPLITTCQQHMAIYGRHDRSHLFNYSRPLASQDMVKNCPRGLPKVQPLPDNLRSSHSSTTSYPQNSQNLPSRTLSHHPTSDPRHLLRLSNISLDDGSGPHCSRPSSLTTIEELPHETRESIDIESHPIRDCEHTSPFALYGLPALQSSHAAVPENPLFLGIARTARLSRNTVKVLDIKTSIVTDQNLDTRRVPRREILLHRQHNVRSQVASAGYETT